MCICYVNQNNLKKAMKVVEADAKAFQYAFDVDGPLDVAFERS